MPVIEKRRVMNSDTMPNPKKIMMIARERCVPAGITAALASAFTLTKPTGGLSLFHFRTTSEIIVEAMMIEPTTTK